MEDYVGKTLKDDSGKDYIILSQITYKNIPCVYAMEVKEDNEEGNKLFFQIKNDNDIYLVSIDSPKMIVSLQELLFKKNIQEDKPRKIKDDESIADYLAYLEDYYKSRVVTII